MGVDITTYRCRVGSFNPQRSARMMLMPVFIDFSKLVKMIGVVIFIKMLLFLAGIEQNPGPITPPTINTKIEDQTVSLGEPWELNIPISGDGPFTVKVMKDGTELTGNGRIEISFTANCVTVKVNKLIMEDSGSYRIDLSNGIGTDFCAFKMKVHGKLNFRYQYLLVEIGTKVLRKLFDCKVGNDFVRYLAANPIAQSTLTSLMTGKNRKITVAQEQLLPPIKTKPVSSDYDITLLTCLLRNVCGLSPPNNLVWMNPLPTDKSVEATITRLRNCRNNISHSGTVLFPETDLNDKWTELNDILSELNKHCGKDGITDLPALIHAASHMNIDEEMHNQITETIKRWDEYNQGLKMEFNKFQDVFTEDVKGIKRQLESLVQEARNTKRAHVDDDSDNKEPVTIYKRVKVDRVGEMEESLTKVEGKPDVDDGSDIREELLRIYKKDCSTLSVSPLFEDETTELLKIYQNPKMFRVNYNKEQRKENSKYKLHEEQTDENKDVIKSYQGIFCKEDCQYKKIYVTGDAGVGKTSFCKRMCLLWCKSVLNDQIEDKSDDEGSDRVKADMQYMSRFDFVFYVTLRDTDLIDVNAMIVEQLFYTDNDKERDETYVRIKNILKNKDCLVIMDGYDEWRPKKIEKKKFDKPTCIYSEKCVTLTTSRPYKINEIRLSPTEIDHQVQITGIDSNSSYDYVQHLVNDMNETNSDAKDTDEFMDAVRKCDLRELLCIPMIASHLVVLWFDDKLTEMSVAHIYSHILDMLFKRAEEKQVKVLQSTGEEFQLPESLAKFTYLQQHAPLLHKLCLLSFKSFFNQDKQVSNLVFTKEQLMSEPYKLTNEESDFLCQIGILSKNKVIGRHLKQKQKLSFIHQSYIEFLAAFFVFSFDKNNSFDEIINEWTCVDDVVQYKNFFLLLTGFSYQKVNILLGKIYTSLSDNLHSCRKNSIFHYDHYDYRKQIISLQNMIVRCFREVRRYNEQDCWLLMEDFIYYDYYHYDYYYDDDDDDDDGDHASVLKQLLLLNTTRIKSIRLNEYYQEFDQIHCLQYLIIENMSSADYVKFTECMLHNKSTLHTVCIYGYTTLMPELPVSHLDHLTSLSLSFVKIQHKSLDNLVTYLSNNVLIENIKLCYVSCVDHQDDYSNCTLTLNLPKHTKLSSLCLDFVNILCSNVNKSSLKYIALLSLSERIVRLCYSDLFNCVKYSQLEHLYINGSYLYMLDYNTMETLTSTVKTLPCIKSLKLWNMKLPDDVLIRLHPDVTQVKIKLGDVTMSRQCFHCFINSFVNNKSEIKVELDMCNITSGDGETHCKLSDVESVNYMSEYLKSIQTINITYKDDDGLHFETSGQ